MKGHGEVEQGASVSLNCSQLFDIVAVTLEKFAQLQRSQSPPAASIP